MTPQQKQLVERHIEFARGIARKMARKYNFTYPDVEADAFYGLVVAATRHNLDRGPFVPYAVTTIWGTVLHGMRDREPGGRARHEGRSWAPQREARLDAPLRDASLRTRLDEIADDRGDEERMMFLDAVRRLPQRERTAVILRALGLPQSEVAERMGFSQMHISRILGSAAKQLEVTA